MKQRLKSWPEDIISNQMQPPYTEEQAFRLSQACRELAAEYEKSGKWEDAADFYGQARWFLNQAILLRKRDTEEYPVS